MSVLYGLKIAPNHSNKLRGCEFTIGRYSNSCGSSFRDEWTHQHMVIENVRGFYSFLRILAPTAEIREALLSIVHAIDASKTDRSPITIGLTYQSSYKAYSLDEGGSLEVRPIFKTVKVIDRL
jgi:hypothetical protein